MSKVSCLVILLDEKQTETLLDNAVTIHNKMQVIYKEMIQDGAKSNVAKWNLMGGTIQACETLPTVHVEQ